MCVCVFLGGTEGRVIAIESLQSISSVYLFQCFFEGFSRSLFRCSSSSVGRRTCCFFLLLQEMCVIERGRSLGLLEKKQSEMQKKGNTCGFERESEIDE